MTGVGELSQTLAQWLEKQGLSAVTAWPDEKRRRSDEAIAAVSLRALESGPAGYQDYLGERFDQDRGEWEELYGKKMTLTFGLDLYAASAQEVTAALERLGEILSQSGPQGMASVGFSAGETTYQSESRRYFCPVQAKFQVWATATAREEASFLDFVIKGENKA